MRPELQTEVIRILVADDDPKVLDCYKDAVSESEPTSHMRALDALAAELFDPEENIVESPKFELIACAQGSDAVALATVAANEGVPFDVVILDVRMPPGIDGVEAGCRIRELDPGVEIVFVSGYSDMAFDELQKRVPPPIKLHYFNKPLSFAQLALDVVSMVRTGAVGVA